MKTTMTKTFKMLVAALMVAVLAVSLTACGGKSDEEVIREGVTSEFETIKNYDGTGTSEIFGDVSEMAELDQFGISADDFFKTWLSGFDYSVDDVTVDGNNATVKVTVTIKSFAEAMEDFQTRISEIDATTMADKTQEELYAEMGTMLMDCIDSASLMTETVELPYTLNGNEWAPGAGFESALSQALFGGLV